MKYLPLFVVGLLGCNPKAGVVVEVSGDGFRVSVVNCTRPAQHLPIGSIAVHRIDPSFNAEPVCVLYQYDGDDLPDGWRYGEPAPGYELGECAPLEPWARYEIRIMAGQSTASAVVAVREDGTVTSVRSGCDWKPRLFR